MVFAVKEVVKLFVLKRKVWKLKEDATRVDFENEFQRLTHSVGPITSIEGLWKSIKEDLLISSDVICGWTRGPSKRWVTSWWNDNVDIAVKEKRKLPNDQFIMQKE